MEIEGKYITETCFSHSFESLFVLFWTLLHVCDHVLVSIVLNEFSRLEPNVYIQKQLIQVCVRIKFLNLWHFTHIFASISQNFSQKLFSFKIFLFFFSPDFMMSLLALIYYVISLNILVLLPWGRLFLTLSQNKFYILLKGNLTVKTWGCVYRGEIRHVQFSSLKLTNIP